MNKEIDLNKVQLLWKESARAAWPSLAESRYSCIEICSLDSTLVLSEIEDLC